MRNPEAKPYDTTIFKEYCTTTFKLTNKLDKHQFDNAKRGYDFLYSKLLPTNKLAKILDIGCGAGHFLYYLESKNYKNYIGIDISPEQVNFVKENINEHVLIADAFEYLNNENEEFDVIVGNDIIEHIPKNRSIELMQLIHAALKPDGFCLLKTGNMSAPFALHLRYIDITHETGFTKESLSQLFLTANFREVQIYPKYSDGSIMRQISQQKIKLVYRILFGRIAPDILDPLIIGVGFK